MPRTKFFTNTIYLAVKQYFNPLMPVPAVTGCNERWLLLPWCHHLWPKSASLILNFAEGKDLPVIPTWRSEWLAYQLCLKTCIKMLRNLSEKLGEKFPSTTLGYSLVWIAHLNDAFFGIIELGAIAVEGRQSLHQKDKKITKRDCHFIVQKWNFDFCTYPGKNVINLMLVERKASCHLARANLAHMQAEMSKKCIFC